MEGIINNIINSFIRHLDMSLRIILSLVFFTLALIAFKNTINPKSDTRPVRIGYAILFMLGLFASIIYVTL